MEKTNKNALYTHALAALETADMALAHATELAINGLHRVEDITPENLTSLLAKEFSQARVETINVADAHDGMTLRNKWDLTWNEQGIKNGLPSQIFIKATPEKPYLRETLSMLHMAEQEVRFYNQIQPELPELAPEAYYAAYYPGGRFLLIMEVLEARGLTPYWQAHECTVEHARAVLTALATLHAKFWESERFNSDLVWVRPRTQRFGFEWHQKSFNLARKTFLESAAGENMPAQIRDTLQLWDEKDRQVYAYWDTLPATLLHGDTHLGNTFSYPDGRAGFFDWQVIYRGNGLRDVCYFLLLSLHTDTLKKHEKELVEHYFNELEVRGINLNRELSWLHYCLFSLDALDANIKTQTRGGYGHANSAQQRAYQAVLSSMLENGVADLLKQVVRNGSI